MITEDGLRNLLKEYWALADAAAEQALWAHQWNKVMLILVCEAEANAFTQAAALLQEVLDD